VMVSVAECDREPYVAWTVTVNVPVAVPAVIQTVVAAYPPDGTVTVEAPIEVVGPPEVTGDTLGAKFTVPVNPSRLVTVSCEKVWELGT
jgi:hypothetical protein